MSDEVQRIAGAIARLSPEEKEHLFDLLAARGQLPRTLERRPTHAIQADPPRSGRPPAQPPDYLITFDGGSKGNPGWGYGSYHIQRVVDGAERLERVEFGDGYTSNEAEYDTLIEALEDLIGRIEEAGRRPAQFRIEVRGDSALVINQIQGQWQARDERMAARRDSARALLDRFAAAELKAHPREQSVRILGH
ncbi:MAG: reverse transcriptase-like protein [Anaerolineae bacterium]|nr:reverse transcriptase-like protein [Anaerolineae bacterium]